LIRSHRNHPIEESYLAKHFIQHYCQKYRSFNFTHYPLSMVLVHPYSKDQSLVQPLQQQLELYLYFLPELDLDHLVSLA